MQNNAACKRKKRTPPKAIAQIAAVQKKISYDFLGGV